MSASSRPASTSAATARPSTCWFRIRRLSAPTWCACARQCRRQPRSAGSPKPRGARRRRRSRTTGPACASNRRAIAGSAVCVRFYWDHSRSQPRARDRRANVAVLMLLRSMQRQKEVAVRLALGSGWRHISRMLLTETGIICIIALGAGIAMTAVLLGSLSPAIERTSVCGAERSRDHHRYERAGHRRRHQSDGRDCPVAGAVDVMGTRGDECLAAGRPCRDRRTADAAPPERIDRLRDCRLSGVARRLRTHGPERRQDDEHGTRVRARRPEGVANYASRAELSRSGSLPLVPRALCGQRDGQ